MDFQDAGRFIEGGAAGHHVIDQNDRLAAQLPPTFERAAYVGGPLLERKGGLSGGVAAAHEDVGAPGEKTSSRETARDLAGLVEATLGKSPRVQGQGQDQSRGFGGQVGGQAVAEPGGDTEVMTVFEGVDEAIQGKLVAVQRESAIEVRGCMQAAAAMLAMGGGLGATRTAV